MRIRPVLVIEDEADVRGVLNEILELYGYSATMVSDGLDGLRLAQENKYDLIITDLGIPGISGLEVIKRLRATSNKTPALITTGVIFDNAEIEMRSLRPCDVLLKPFRIEDLMKKMKLLSAHSEVGSDKVERTK
jgi:DNA-binding response OmpR family regulator